MQSLLNDLSKLATTCCFSSGPPADDTDILRVSKDGTPFCESTAESVGESYRAAARLLVEEIILKTVKEDPNRVAARALVEETILEVVNKLTGATSRKGRRATGGTNFYYVLILESLTDDDVSKCELKSCSNLNL